MKLQLLQVKSAAINWSSVGFIAGIFALIGTLNNLAKKSKPKESNKGAASAAPKRFIENMSRRLSTTKIWLVQKSKAILKYTLIIALLLALLPFVLTIIYRFDGIKPTSTLMLSRHLTLKPVDRQWIDIDDVAPALYQSVLVSEDGKFCAHNGVDWEAVNLVITDALEGERPRGASTITMQLGKNLFLWNGRSYLRKILEVPVAIWIDFVLPKKRIMEIYLNIAEWDDNGVYGAEAGSQSHFGKSAANLTTRQSALMAVTLPNPILRNPAKPSSGLNRLARTIEQRAEQSGAYVKCLK